MPLDTNIEITQEHLDAVKDVHNLLDQFKSALEAKNEATIANIEEKLKLVEDVNSEVAKARASQKAAEEQLAEIKKSAGENEKRIEELELEIAKKSGKTNLDLIDASDKRAVKRAKMDSCPVTQNWVHWVQKGDDADVDLRQMSMDIKSTLRTDRDVQGGYLIPQVMDSELRKDIREVSPMRQFCRQRLMPSKTMEVPRRSQGIARALFEGESEEGSEGISTYVNEEVTCYRQSHTVPVTKDMLYNPSFDVESEIMVDVLEAFAAGEGFSIVKGTGHKGPKGIVNDSRIETVQTASAGAIAFEDFATIIGKLKRGQNPGFLMNRVTLAEIWKLKGTDGHPIWAPISMGGQTPATIFGYAYSADVIDLDNHVPTTSNTKPVIFGDFMRGYEIFDMAGVELIRDDYTQKKKAIIEMTFHRYLTGQVILPEAIKILTVQ